MGSIPEDGVYSHRERQTSQPPRAGVVGGILRRKQVSLDLLAPNEFFDIPEEDKEVEEVETPNVIFPLRFAPRVHNGNKGGGGGHGGHGGGGHGDVEKGSGAPPIRKAMRKDKIMAIILACLLTAFVGVCVGWKTHEEKDHSLFGIVGTACVTQCLGDKDYRNFFLAHHDHFELKDVSLLSADSSVNFISNLKHLLIPLQSLSRRNE